MKTDFLMNYLLSCLLLLLPIMAWNLVFASKLPWAYSEEVFSKNIPVYIINGENILRLFGISWNCRDLGIYGGGSK